MFKSKLASLFLLLTIGATASADKPKQDIAKEKVILYSKLENTKLNCGENDADFKSENIFNDKFKSINYHDAQENWKFKLPGIELELPTERPASIVLVSDDPKNFEVISIVLGPESKIVSVTAEKFLPPMLGVDGLPVLLHRSLCDAE